MADVPDVLKGVLANDDTLESLKAIRDMLATTLDGRDCSECGRTGPDTKDIAPLTNRLMDCLARIDALSVPQAVSQPSGNVSVLEDARSRIERRTGRGTESTAAPQSVSKRQGGRRDRHSNLPK